EGIRLEFHVCPPLSPIPAQFACQRRLATRVDVATAPSAATGTSESNRCVSQQGAVKRRTRARSGYAAWASSRRPQHLPGRGLARQCKVADRPWHAFGLRSGNMKGDTAPASSIRRQLLPQHRAVERLRVLAKPYRLRVQVDEGGTVRAEGQRRAAALSRLRAGVARGQESSD